MDSNKKHIGLLVYADDKGKTRLGNIRTEAMEWWSVLTEEAKWEIIRKYKVSNLESTALCWKDLLFVFNSEHNRF